MKSIKKELDPLRVQPTGPVPDRIRSSVSAVSTANSDEAKLQPKNLSTSIAEHLLSLMKDVTKEEVSPRTVEAACKCAQQMYNIMKLNVEMKKIGL